MGSVKRKLAGLLVLLPLAGHAGEQGHYVPGSWSPTRFDIRAVGRPSRPGSSFSADATMDQLAIGGPR